MSTIDIGESDILTALRSFILGEISCEVIKGLGNGVPTPLGGYIAITPLFSNRLSTNVDTYEDNVTTGFKNSLQPKQYAVQIDCYGASSGDWATALSNLFCDDYAYELFPANIKPLYADDPKMMPIVDGEQNFVERWTFAVNLQYNPTTQTPMQFADGSPTLNIYPV